MASATAVDFNPAQVVRCGDGNVQVFAAASRGGRHVMVREISRHVVAQLLDSNRTWTAKELRVIAEEASQLAYMAEWRARADELGEPVDGAIAEPRSADLAATT